MLQILEVTHGDIIATKANDVLVKNDYQKIQPLIHNIISQGKKVKWYFEMEAGVTPALTAFSYGNAELFYSSMHLLYANDMDKIALVGPLEWEQCMRSMVHPYYKSQVAYFDRSRKEEALAWLASEEKKTKPTRIT